MPNCAVFGCDNYTRKTKGMAVKYHSFPKDNELSAKWIIACKRQDNINTENGMYTFLLIVLVRLLKYSNVKASFVLEREFNKFHDNGLSNTAPLFQALYNEIVKNYAVDIPKEVALCFIRTRTYIRLNHLNKKINIINSERKLKAKLHKLSNIK